MKRTLLIITAALALLVTGLFTALVVCVKLNAVHQFVLARVNKAIPGTLTLDRLKLAILDLRVEATGFVLSDSSGKELAGFDRLYTDISMFGLLRRALIVETVELDHPWALLEVDSSGSLSIARAFAGGEPSPKDTAGAPEPDSTTKPFQVELRNLHLRGGRVLFASGNDSLSVEAGGLSITAAGETGTMSADVTIALDSALLSRPSGGATVRDLSLLARMSNMDVDTVALLLRTDDSEIALYGKASSLKTEPFVDLTLAAAIALSDIRTAAGLGESLSGRATVDLKVDGSVGNPDAALDVSYDGGIVWGYPLRSLLLKARLGDRMLNLSPLHAEAAQGNAEVTGAVDVRGMFPDGFLGAPGSVQELMYDLEIEGKQIALQKLLPGMAGTADLALSLDGRGAHPDSLRARLGLTAGIAAFRLDTAAIPLNVSAVCSAGVTDGIAQVHALTARLGSSTLSFAGEYGISSGNMDAQLDLQVASLGELLSFVGTDSAAGTARVSAHVGGGLKMPRAEVEADASDVEFGNVRIGGAKLNVALNEQGTASVKELVLVNGASTLRLEGTAHVLDKGTLVPTDRMELDLSLIARELQISDFVDSAAGAVSIDAQIGGTAADPQGHVRLSADGLRAAGQSVAMIALDARVAQQRVTIEPFQAAITPGEALTITGWATFEDSFALSLSVPGIHLNTIAALGSTDSLDGVLAADIELGGTYTRPEARGDLGIRDISMGETVLDDITLHLDLHEQQLALNGTAVGDIRAGYNLDSKAFLADLSFGNMILTPYLALTGQSLDGALSGSMKVAGNADTLAGITGALEISSLVLGYNNVTVLETHDLSATMAKNRYTVPAFSIALAGEGLLTGSAEGLPEGPHDAAVNGVIPLSVVRYFSPDFADIEGTVEIDAEFSGTPEAPDLRADVLLKNIGMTVPGLSQRLHSLNGQILADQNAVRVKTLRGSLDDGVMSMTGELKLDNFAPSDLGIDIVLEALPIGVPGMLDLVLDAKLRVAGTPDTTRVEGDIVLLDGLYYQDIVINPIAGVGQRKRKEAPAPQENTTPYLKNMRFDVGVQARSPFRVDNNMAQLTIAPDLQLMGALQAPALNGRAHVEEGTITYRKKVFTVERGVIDFVNPYAIEPEIDIQGTVPVRDWVIRIVISGTPDDLVFKLSSDDPGLEDQDLLSLLVVGKTTAELQGGLGAGGGQSNEQMLASLVASTFGEDIKKATGLDRLEVKTGDESNEDSDRIAVTMGKQVTKRLGTLYTVESEDGEVVQRATAEYRILQNLYAAGFQDTRGVFGGELRLTWERR